MKPGTFIGMVMENVGSPDEKKEIEGPMKACALEIVRWLSRVSINSHIRITIGRDLAHAQKVNVTAKRGATDDLAAMVESELDALLNNSIEDETDGY